MDRNRNNNLLRKPWDDVCTVEIPVPVTHGKILDQCTFSFQVFFVPHNRNIARIQQPNLNQALRVGLEIDKNDLIQKDAKR